MTVTRFCFAVLLTTTAVMIPLMAAQTEEFKTSDGPLKITPIQHASFYIEAGGQVVHVDPAQGTFDNAPKADLILITDIHPDHLAPKIIEQVSKPGTQIVAPEAVAKTLTQAAVLRNGESKKIGAWTIEAIPMYNTKPNEQGQIFHEKGRGNGYVVTYGGLRVYIAGDTEGVPEMRALKNIDVAFVPMNLPDTMPPQDAADAVKAFHPKVVYPYHYRGQDPKIFEQALQGTGIEVRLRNWY